MKRQKFSEIDAIIIKRELEALKGKKLKGLIQRNRDYLLVFDKNEKVLISLDPARYRIHLTERSLIGDPNRFTGLQKGYTLINVRVKKWDRLIYLIFSKDRGIRKLVLAVELTGKHSNLILISEDGKIIDAHRRITSSSVRPVVPGINYSPPPPKPFDPEKDVEKLAQFIPWLTPPYGEKIYMALNETTYLYCADKDIYSPIELKCNKKKYFSIYSALLDFFFGKDTETTEIKGGKEERLLQELEKVRDYELYRIAGEKILAGEFEKEGDYLTVHVGGKEFRIKSKDKPSQVAEEFFKKYKKYRRGYLKILEKLKEVPSTRIVKIDEKKEEVPYEKFISPGGFTVYRGKNVRGNEIITFQIASPEDYFLHVENSPGSHVIITSGKRAVSDEDLEFAAKLAFERSKRAKDLKGIVIVTKKKYLKRGEKPGQVVISKILNTIEVKLR